MAEQIKVSEFTITAHGDPSAGIFSSVWTVGPEFYFENEEELEEFRERLAELFSDYSGEKVSVYTAEEIEAENEYLRIIDEQSDALMDELNDNEFN